MHGNAMGVGSADVVHEDVLADRDDLRVIEDPLPMTFDDGQLTRTFVD